MDCTGSFRGGADSPVIIGSSLSSDLVMSRAGLRSKTLLKAGKIAQPVTRQ